MLAARCGQLRSEIVICQCGGADRPKVSSFKHRWTEVAQRFRPGCIYDDVGVGAEEGGNICSVGNTAPAQYPSKRKAGRPLNEFNDLPADSTGTDHAYCALIAQV